MKVIAIDGHASAGKGTAAFGVARVLGLKVLDSGSFYRAVVCADGDMARVSFSERGVCIDELPVRDEVLRTDLVTNLVPVFAAKPEIRKGVHHLLRGYAEICENGLVADGRDMGTVVFPEAKLKVFLTANPFVRATRAKADPKRNLGNTEVGIVMAQVMHRDMQDETRTCSPLRKADDAFFLDTSEMNPNIVIDAIVELWRIKNSKV